MYSFLCYHRTSAGFEAAEECYEPPPPAVLPFEHLLATATASGRYGKRLSWTGERTGLGGSTTQPVRKEKYVMPAMGPVREGGLQIIVTFSFSSSHDFQHDIP